MQCGTARQWHKVTAYPLSLLPICYVPASIDHQRPQQHNENDPRSSSVDFDMASQAPSLLSKPYRCNDCTSSFATPGAWACHGFSTGHNFSCTVPGCQQQFLSEAGINAHRSSPAHKKLSLTVTTPCAVSSADRASSKLEGKNAKAAQIVPVFTCTQAGCNKMFRTAESRTQHLHSPAHRKTVVQETQLGVKTAKAENDVRTDSTSAATAISEPPQQQTPHRDPEPSLEASIKLHQATLVAARAKLASNDVHHGNADTGECSTQSLLR